MYATSINSLYKGKGSLDATGQTTKLHLILAATLKKSGGHMSNTIDSIHNEKCM